MAFFLDVSTSFQACQTLGYSSLVLIPFRTLRADCLLGALLPPVSVSAWFSHQGLLPSVITFFLKFNFWHLALHSSIKKKKVWQKNVTLFFLSWNNLAMTPGIPTLWSAWQPNVMNKKGLPGPDPNWNKKQVNSAVVCNCQDCVGPA